VRGIRRLSILLIVRELSVDRQTGRTLATFQHQAFLQLDLGGVAVQSGTGL